MPGNALELASAYVTILPSTRGLGAALSADMEAPLAAAGKTGGGLFSKGMIGGLGKIGSALAAIGIAAFLKDSVAAAMKAEVSWGQLSRAVDNTGVSFDSVEGSLRDTLATESRLSAFSQGDLRTALTSLVQITGSVSTAQKDLGLTADLARAKNMDMANAAKLVGRVQMGSTAILTRYGIVLKKGATATEALAALQKKFGGAAEAYGNTTQGAVDKAKNSIEELQVSVGNTLLPVVGSLAKAGSSVMQSFDAMLPPLKTAVLVVGGLAAAALIALPWVASLSKAALALGLTSAASAAPLAGFATGIGMVASGAPVASYATVGFGTAIGGVTAALVAIAAPLAVFALTLMRTDAVSSYQQAVFALEGGMTDLQNRVAAGVTTWADAKTALDKGAFSTLTTAQKADVAGKAQTELANAVDGTTAAWQAETLAMSGTRHANEDGLANAIAVRAAQDALTVAIKRYGKNSPEAALATMKLHDAQKLAAQTADGMTASEVKAAIKAGLLKGKVSDYITVVRKIPKSKTTTITADIHDSALNGFLGKLAKIGIGRGLGFTVTGKVKAHMAGAFVPSPEVALIGEQPEYVINPRQPSAASLITSAARDAGMIAPASSAKTIVFNNYAQGVTGGAIVQQINAALNGSGEMAGYRAVMGATS